MRAYELFESNEPIFSGPVFSKRVDLKKAIAAEWGEVNVEFKMVKRSGSRFGIDLGLYHLIDGNGNVVGMWETTEADMIPGRGKVSSGYGRIAKNDKKAKTDNVNEPTKTEKSKPTKKATKSDLEEALTQMYSGMRSIDSNFTRYEKTSEYSFNLKNWGEWVLPYDGSDNEDDQDDLILSDEFHDKLIDLKDKVESKCPNVLVQYSMEEKKWISVSVHSKLN